MGDDIDQGNINIGARQQNKMFALVQSSNPNGCTILMGIVWDMQLLFKTNIAVCLWGNLSSVTIFTCMKMSEQTYMSTHVLQL